MKNNVEGIALVGLVSRWRGTIKVVCMQERGNKPYRQVEDKLWFKKLDGEGDSATGKQLICGIISCAEHRNNFCNAGALGDSHKMKAALKVQFTLTLGLNEILTGVETEESPTREVGAAVSFTTTDCYCQFNELKALRFQSNCKGTC